MKARDITDLYSYYYRLDKLISDIKGDAQSISISPVLDDEAIDILAELFVIVDKLGKIRAGINKEIGKLKEE